MYQLPLFTPSSETLSNPQYVSYFDDMLKALQVDYGTLWPDRFGAALRKWMIQQKYRPIKTLSLFSGGGGLDIGFADAGFHSLEMVEIEKNM